MGKKRKNNKNKKKRTGSGNSKRNAAKKKTPQKSTSKLKWLFAVVCVAALAFTAFSFSSTKVEPTMTKSSWQKFIDSNPYDMSSKKLLEGNSGEIFYIRQIHAASLGVDSVKQQKLTAEYQFQIFLTLMELKPDVVFLEGQWSGGTADELRNDHPEILAQMKEDYPLGWYRGKTKITQLSSYHQEALYEDGAAKLYLIMKAIEGQPAHVHGVPQDAMMALYNRVITEARAWVTAPENNDALTTPKNIPEVVIEWERFFVKYVRRYLRQQGKKRVALIFGAGHRFKPHFEKDDVNFHRVGFIGLFRELNRIK